MSHDVYILPFDQIRAADLPLVGGKGANLGEMTRAGFPVPPGFCLTTAAFHTFLANCSQMDDFYQALAALPEEDILATRKIGGEIRQTLQAVTFPEVVETAVRQTWHNLDPTAAYAVRSSATAEDLPDASFAGQQDTYLNVRGAHDGQNGRSRRHPPLLGLSFHGPGYPVPAAKWLQPPRCSSFCSGTANGIAGDFWHLVYSRSRQPKSAYYFD